MARPLPLAITLPIALAACAAAGTPPDTPSSAPSGSSTVLSSGVAVPESAPPTLAAGATATLTLRSGATLTLPAAWEVTPGPYGTSSTISVSGVQRGSIREFSEFPPHRPAAPESEPASSDAEADRAVAEIFDELVEAGTLTPGTVERIRREWTGDFFSSSDCKGLGYLQLPGPAGTISFSYTVSREGYTPPQLRPTYRAMRYDVARRSLLVIDWFIREDEPQVQLWASLLAPASSPSTEDESVRAKQRGMVFQDIDLFLEGTPRTRLSWGEELQRVDEVLASTTTPA